MDEIEIQRLAAGMFSQLWSDPAVGSQIRKRAKELNPNISIPEENPVAIEIAGKLTATEEKLATLQRLFEEQQAKVAESAQETKLRVALSEAQSRFRLTDDGLSGTIKLMQERQIADPMAAAALYVDGLPKAQTSTPRNIIPDSKMNLFGSQKHDDSWEKLHTDPDGFFADVVNQVFSENPAA